MARGARLALPGLLLLAFAACGPVQIGSGQGERAWLITPDRPTITFGPGNRTLDVGPDRTFQLPSVAARYARDGNTVLLDPGAYDDCAEWKANNLTIAARGAGVVFTGRTCRGMAIFIISGNNVTVRGITFMHAAVPDGNGAGIRAQGGNLTIEDSRFIDNQEGILSGPGKRTTIRIVDSEFRGNGGCIGACAHAVYAGNIGLLDVEDSRFTDTHVGHDIKSRALRTVLRGNDISDGPDGNASYLVDIPNGGDLLMEHNVLSKGPHTDNKSTAVAIGEEGVRNPTDSLVIRDNTFTNLLPGPTAFVTNRTGKPVELSGNTFAGRITPLR